MEVTDLRGRSWLLVGLLVVAAGVVAVSGVWLHSRSTSRHDCLISLGLEDSRVDFRTRLDCGRATQLLNGAGWQARTLSATASMSGFQVSCRLHYQENGDTMVVYRRHSDAIAYEFCKNRAATGWTSDYLPPYTL